MTDAEHLEKERRRLRIVAAYHRVFESADGRAVLEDLVAAFGMDRPAFIALDKGRGSLGFDPIYAAKRDGQQDIRRHIEAKLAAPAEADANLEKPKNIVITS